MTTYRVVKRERFAQIDRGVINDRSISFRAKGILTWIMDKPDDWRFTSETLTEVSTEGRDAIRAALRELEGAGYMRLERVQNPETGRWQSVRSVFEGRAEDGFPVVGKPAAGKPGAITETETETENLSSKTPSSPPRKQRERDEVWDALVEVCGDVKADTETSRRAKCAKELKKVGATAAEIRARAREMKRRWPNVTITDTGLVGRWSTVEPRRRPVNDFPEEV